MVVATKVVLPQRPLAVVGATEFTAPDNECVVEHAAILEVLHQRGGGLVGLAALVAQSARQSAVLIPAGMVKLDEPHAALSQSPRLQAVGGEGAWFFHVVAVHLEHLLRFAGDVGDFRDGGLHAERHLVLRDARLDLGVRVAGELQLVKFAEAVEHHSTALAVDAAWVLQVQHRVGPERKRTP